MNYNCAFSGFYAGSPGLIVNGDNVVINAGTVATETDRASAGDGPQGFAGSGCQSSILFPSESYIQAKRP
jgi:hypothetical protein